MIKGLTQIGNSKALVIDKATLQAAGLSDNPLFQITINPNGGLLIQSVDHSNEDLHKKNVKKVIKKHSKLIERLKDR